MLTRRGLDGNTFGRHDQERTPERLFPPRLVASGRAHVPGTHLSLEQDRTISAVACPQLRHPLRRLPVGDARIVETSHDEDGWVLRAAHVVIGRVAPDVLV